MNIHAGPIAAHVEPGIGWARVLGFGISWKDTRRSGLTFSERIGARRRLQIGPWRIGVLWPDAVWRSTQ